MKVKKYTIKPISPWLSPLRSDTLHGLIACQVREWEGEKACKELLNSFNEEPAFTCSSAFVQGFIPFPTLAPIKRARFSQLFSISNEKKELIQTLKKYKEFKKNSFIPFAVYEKYKDNLSLEAIFNEYCNKNSTWEKPKIDSQIEQHNTVNRITQKVDDGLFSQNFSIVDANFDLYVKAKDHDFIEKYLERIGELGFGADSNLGKGRFKLLPELTEDKTELFQSSGEYNLSLSVISSEDLSELDGYYKIFTKKGRTWTFMSKMSPFKKPFLALEEGAILKNLPKNGVLKNIHVDENIVQLCHGLALPCTLSGTLSATQAKNSTGGNL